MKKHSVKIFFILIFLMGVSGCMNGNENDNSPAKEDRLSAQEMMLAYIRNRYPEDEFGYGGLIGGGVGSAGAKITVSSQMFPDALIIVAADEADGNIIYSDNYMYHKYANQTESFLIKILDPVIGRDFRLFLTTSPSATTLSLPGDASFEVFISNEKTLLEFTAIVEAGFLLDDKNKTEEKFNEAFKSSSVEVTAAVFYFSDENIDFDTIKNAGSLTDINFGHNVPNVTVFNLGRDDATFDWR